MKSKRIWYVTLCALLILANCTELTVPLRVALAMNALVLVWDIVCKIRGYVCGNNET